MPTLLASLARNISAALSQPRRVGSRDDLLAEIIWSLGEPTLALAAEGAQGHGGQRIAMIMGRFAAMT